MTRAVIFILFLLLLLCVPAVSAIQYISFAQPDTLTQKDIYLYNATGSLLGLYNTTSTAIEMPAAGDIMFVIKPQYSTPLDDPVTWLGSMFSYIGANVTVLVIIVFLIALFLGRK